METQYAGRVHGTAGRCVFCASGRYALSRWLRLRLRQYCYLTPILLSHPTQVNTVWQASFWLPTALRVLGPQADRYPPFSRVAVAGAAVLRSLAPPADGYCRLCSSVACHTTSVPQWPVTSCDPAKMHKNVTSTTPRHPSLPTTKTQSAVLVLCASTDLLGTAKHRLQVDTASTLDNVHDTDNGSLRLGRLARLACR